MSARGSKAPLVENVGPNRYRVLGPTGATYGTGTAVYRVVTMARRATHPGGSYAMGSSRPRPAYAVVLDGAGDRWLGILEPVGGGQFAVVPRTSSGNLAVCPVMIVATRAAGVLALDGTRRLREARKRAKKMGDRRDRIALSGGRVR